MLKRIEIFDKQENAFIAASKEDKKYALQKQQIAKSRNRLTNGCVPATSPTPDLSPPNQDVERKYSLPSYV